MGLCVLFKVFSDRESFDLNWAGVRVFEAWCRANDMPRPFADWNHGNGESLTWLEYEEVWDNWVTEFEHKFPQLIGSSIQSSIWSDDLEERNQARASIWYDHLKYVIDNEADVEML